MLNMKALFVLIIAASFPGFVMAQGVYTPGGYTNVKTKSLVDMRYRNMVRQSEDLSCGAAAVATILNNVYGAPVTEKQIIDAIIKVAPEEERSRISEEGFSLLEMKRFMEALGFVVGGFKVPSVDDLDNLKVPVIAMVNVRGYNHFVVIKKKAGDKVLIADPAFGNTSPTKEAFENQWNGILLVIVAPNTPPNPEFMTDPSLKSRPLELNSIRTAINAVDIALPGEY